MARPLQPRLNRAKIARAAIKMVDAGNKLQVIPLAKSLNVQVSSLYNHVKNRDDIIHAMREELFARYPREPLEGQPWQEAIRKFVTDSWRMYAEHPGVLQLLLTVVVDEPATVDSYEQLAQVLRIAGVPDTEILTIIEVLDAFVFGGAMDALSPERIFSASEEKGSIARLLASHPVGAERNARMVSYGVELLITAIESKAGGREAHADGS